MLAICWLVNPSQEWLWTAYLGTLAAVTADTWATELGAFSPIPPRLITSGETVPRGSSGGITLLGTLGSLLGAGLIAALYPLRPNPPNTRLIMGLITLAGFSGSLLAGRSP